MALIRGLKHRRMERNSVHDPIAASYTVFSQDGKTFLQIDSYGRDEREIPGKKSQSMQLDDVSAKQLFDVLREAFGFN